MISSLDRLATLSRLAKFMRDYDLAYLRLRQGDFAVEMTLPSGPAMPAVPDDVTSPAAGIFHLRHSSQNGPLVSIGDEVSSGQIVAMIAHGALYDVVRAPRGGTVTSIVKAEGDQVAIGESLLQLA